MTRVDVVQCVPDHAEMGVEADAHHVRVIVVTAVKTVVVHVRVDAIPEVDRIHAVVVVW